MRVLTTRAELADATGHHPVAVIDVGGGFVAPAYAVGSLADGAVVFHRRSDHGVPGSAALGTASGLATLLDDPAVRAAVTGGGNRHVSVPRGLMPVALERLDLGSRGGEWDWMWTRSEPPVVPHEGAVEVLDPADRAEMVDFLDVHNPRTHGQPFARPEQHWVGVRDDDGVLVALGCSEPGQSGVPSLAGIAVDVRRRGEGWGAAVTAHLTRLAVRATGACALGMFADNDVARRLYHRLGYTTGMEWTSRWFGA
ncbi:MAG TPA: GNAT family N-acetyltransferase [Ornithinibacter sp.]|nr:GNAT family N-acetyltransferase [Ornithinibacter sp.]